MNAPERRNLTLEAALAEAEARHVAANPRSRAAHAAAARALPGGNTRSVLHYTPFPVVLDRAEGARVTDLDGHDYLDLLGEYSAGIYGHSHPAIRAAIDAALDRGLVRGGPGEAEGTYAALLAARFPAVERLRFCNSGTEANVLALMAARAFTGRTDVLVVEGGYHGGVLYFSGESPVNLPLPFRRIPYNDPGAARGAIRAAGPALAAAILEPMLGGGGCIPASPEFLGVIREETARTGALLVLDEVMTSRLAPGGLHGALGLRPDLVTFGKYLGGGLSFGAFGGRADILDRFDPYRPDAWPHAGTFNNNALSMAAGLAGLRDVYTPEVAVAFNARGDRLRADLAARMAAAGLPVQVTGRGSMLAFHVARRPPERPGDLPALPAAVKALLHLDLLERGIHLARRGMVTLSLPMTEADLAAFAAAFEEVMRLRGPLLAAALDD